MYACLIMNRWGLVQQIGPWADTKRDKTERAMPPDNRVGGGTINGGTAHPGTSSVITPHIIQPMKIGILKPSAYARQTIIAPTQVMGTRTKPVSGRGGILRQKSGLRPQDTNGFSPYAQTQKDLGNNTSPDWTNTRQQQNYNDDVATEVGDPVDPDMGTSTDNDASINEWHANLNAGPFGSESAARTLAQQISTLNVDPNPDITGHEKLPIAYTENDAMDEIYDQKAAELVAALEQPEIPILGKDYVGRDYVKTYDSPMVDAKVSSMAGKTGKVTVKSNNGKGGRVVVSAAEALKRRTQEKLNAHKNAHSDKVNANRMESANKMSDV